MKIKKKKAKMLASITETLTKSIIITILEVLIMCNKMNRSKKTTDLVDFKTMFNRIITIMTIITMDLMDLMTLPLSLMNKYVIYYNIKSRRIKG